MFSWLIGIVSTVVSYVKGFVVDTVFGFIMEGIRS